MPHAIIEYSANITEDFYCVDPTNIVWGVLVESGLFQTKDIKVRSHSCDDFIVGEKGPDGTFVHVSVAILEGRRAEQKQKLSQSIFNALRPALPEIDSLTVEIRDMAKDSYCKKG